MFLFIYFLCNFHFTPSLDLEVKFLKDVSFQQRRLVHTESEQAEYAKRIQAASNEVIDNLLLDPSNEMITAELKAVVKGFKKPEDFVAYLKAVAFRAGILKKGGHDVGNMFKKPVIRVAVTGAAGNIGYSLLPRIARHAYIYIYI